MTTEPAEGMGPTSGTESTGGTGPTSGTGELLTALGQDVRAIVQEELRRVRTELSDTISESKQAALLLGGAGFLGAMAAGTSAAVVVRILDAVLPRPVAVILATVLYGAGAAALGRAGLAELHRARESLARETPLP